MALFIIKPLHHETNCENAQARPETMQPNAPLQNNSCVYCGAESLHEDLIKIVHTFA